MSVNSRLAVLALMALWPAVSVAAEGCAPCREAGGVFDPGTGVCLPSQIDGFRSVPYSDAQREQLKAYRNSLVAGYNAAAPRLAVTVYLYDRAGTGRDADVAELRDAIGQVTTTRPGVRVQRAGAAALPVSGRRTEGLGGFLTWTDGGQNFGSFLWVLPLQGRYLKVRATYLRIGGDEGAAMKSSLDAVHRMAEAICAGAGAPAEAGAPLI